MNSPHATYQPPRIVLWKNIPWLRGLAITLVVFNHALIMAQPPSDAADVLDLSVLILGKVLAPICVPTFLLASGYFMGRFVKTWDAVRVTVTTFALRYLAWSLVIYAGRWLWAHDLTLGEVLFGMFVAGKANPAYWFALVTIQFFLITPWLVKEVATRPKRALVLAGALQLLATAHTYADAFGHRLLPEMYVSFFVAPWFILGVLLAAHDGKVVAYAAPHRTLLGWLAVALFPLNVAEIIVIGYLRGDGSPASWLWQWGDRVFHHLFAFAAVSWLVLTPASNARWRKWLDWIGMRSLAVLFLLDVFVACAVIALWHGERWLGLSHRPSTVEPAWLASPWVGLPIMVVALGGPLLVVVVVERIAGKRLRTAIFG